MFVLSKLKEIEYQDENAQENKTSKWNNDSNHPAF